MDKPQDPEAAETVQTTSVPAVDLPGLVRLPVGETIQRGDKFLSDDGRYLEMDNLGRLLGVRCLGQVLKKESAWFRDPNAERTNGEQDQR
jgi:hypothetical protein